MNDTKWEKLFDAISSSGVSVTNAQYADLLEPNILSNIIPALEPGHRCYSEDGYRAGPVRLSEILFLQLTLNSHADLLLLLDEIHATGQYECTVEPENILIVHGYR